MQLAVSLLPNILNCGTFVVVVAGAAAVAATVVVVIHYLLNARIFVS